MSTVQSKIWGSNTEVFFTDTISVNVLRINKGGTCSLHTHKSKYNKFYVVSGELKLCVESFDDPMYLGPGVEFTVYPGQEHRFQALMPTVVVETVYTKLDANDINRKLCGYVEECLNSDLWEEL